MCTRRRRQVPLLSSVSSARRRRGSGVFSMGFGTITSVAMVALGASVGLVLGEDLQQSSDVKWLQQPDLTSNGIDIRVDSADGRHRVIADDFACTERSLLTDVHFWGSWFQDKKGQIETVHLKIFSDDPVGTAGSDTENKFSKPDKLLWQKDLARGEFGEELVATVREGEFFWDALRGELVYPGDKQVWEYTVRIDPGEAFEQTGTGKNPTIYWLAISVDLAQRDLQFGWKTRAWPQHFNDDAVIGPDPWLELRYPRGHPYGSEQANSVDMAFTLSFQHRAVEIDTFEFTLGDLELRMPDGRRETIAVSGPTTVAVFFEGAQEGDASDNNGNGRDEVLTEMLELDLTGMSPTLGLVHVGLYPAIPSLGQIEELVNNTPGTLDLPPFTASGTAASFFDIFVEIEAGGGLFHTVAPKRMSTLISHKPPGPVAVYENCEELELYTASGQPTGFFLGCARHQPNPPVEIDVFGLALGMIELKRPDGGSERISLAGPATAQVMIPPDGWAADTDGNGREQVTTRMMELDLTGTSPTLGPVHVTLNPTRPSLGQIEELTNNTPGTLDLPPFTASGTAESFFDIFVEIEVGGVVLLHEVPLRIATVITHKPPAPGEVYVDTGQGPIELLDANGMPTGFFLDGGWLVPNPIRIALRRLGRGRAEVSWPTPATGYILQATASLDPPVRWLAIPPPYDVSGGRYVYRTSGTETWRIFRLVKPIP